MVNRKITTWITDKILKFIKKNKINLVNKKILILGVAYKKNIDHKGLPLKIAENFYKVGYEDYSDPYISKIRFKNTIKKAKKINANLLKRSKIVLIATDH